MRKRYLQLGATVTTSTRARVEYVLGTCVAYDTAVGDRITDCDAFYSRADVWQRCADAWAQHLQDTCEAVAASLIHIDLDPASSTSTHDGDDDDDDDDDDDPHRHRERNVEPHGPGGEMTEAVVIDGEPASSSGWRSSKSGQQ